MILDLNCHSDQSDDSRAPIETYLRWLRKKRGTLPIDVVMAEPGMIRTPHAYVLSGQPGKLTAYQPNTVAV